jgi:uncharacterized protein YgiM (DUF1202 family)
MKKIKNNSAEKTEKKKITSRLAIFDGRGVYVGSSTSWVEAADLARRERRAR